MSRYEETQDDVRRIAPADIATGKQKWLYPDGWQNRGHAIATDDEYIHVAAIGLNPDTHAEDSYRVFRRNAKTGAPADWPDPANIAVTLPWKAGQPVVTGLAVDATHLWVADTAGNQLRVYTKADGKPAPILNGQSSMPLDNPHAIVTDGAGQLWVVTGNRVQRYSYDAATRTMKPTASIPDLARPYGLGWDRTNGASTLYVSEIDTGKVCKGSPGPVERPAEKPHSAISASPPNSSPASTTILVTDSAHR